MSTIGIVGGMGSLATAELFLRIIQNTESHCDADHIHIVIDNNPQIPDRTNAILYDCESPVNAIIKSGIALTSMGADFLLIPCNTSFFFLNQIQPSIDIEVVNMIEKTVCFVKNYGLKKIGLLATDGTIQTNLYQSYLEKSSIECIVPEARHQQGVMEFIYQGVKSGNVGLYKKQIEIAIDSLFSKGVEMIVLGCTELSVCLFQNGNDNRFIDPLQILALNAIAKAGYKFIPQHGIYKKFLCNDI